MGRNSTSALLLLLLVATVAALVGASDSEVKTRTVRIDVDNDDVRVRAYSADGNDRIELEIKTEDGDSDIFEAEFKWNREQESEDEGDGDDNGGDGTEVPVDTPTPTPEPQKPRKKRSEDSAEVEFRFRLSYIVEYRESGDNKGFQVDEDEVVSIYGNDELNNGGGGLEVPQTDAEWSDWERLADEKSGDATVISFQAKTSDDVLTVRGYVSSAAAEAAGSRVELDPNTLKVDIEIDSYPFSSETPDTFLALVARVRTASGFSSSGDDDDHEVSVDAAANSTLDVASGVFKWEPTLSVDGVTVDVVATSFVKESDSEDDDGSVDYRTSFAFPAHGASYKWDPEMQVQYSDSGAASAIAPFWSSLF